MVEEAKTPKQIAEDGFERVAPQFFKKIEELSNRQLKRVMCALVMHPLMNYEVYLPYQQEKDLFKLGIELYNYKFALMSLAFNNDSNVTEVEPEASTNKEGEKNG